MNEREQDEAEGKIAVVRKLLHRTGTRHLCRCPECRAIVAVCALATEAVQIKAARRRVLEKAKRGEPL